MSVFEVANKLAKDRNAAFSAQQAQSYGEDPGYIGGFVASAVSALPELIGFNPSPTAERFRQENPIGGLTSQIASMAVPYAGWARATTAPRLAAGLEAAVARTGIDMAARPVLGGAVREMFRFAPLEMGRLAAGAAFAPNENFGDLFADVAISSALTGGLGGVAGFFRAGGKQAATQGNRIIGADFRLAPTAEFRLGLREGAAAQGGEVAERLGTLRQEILSETAPKAGRISERMDYVLGLDDATREETVGLRALFRPNHFSMKPRAIDRRLLLETAEGNARGVNPGERDEIVKALGFSNEDDFLSNAFYPRVVTAVSDRGAGTVAKLFESPGLQSVGEGTMLGWESQGGHAVIIKRIKSPAREVKAQRVAMIDEFKRLNPKNKAAVPRGLNLPASIKMHGKAAVGKGDKFVVLKTDRPELFVPQASLVGKRTTAQWANWAQSWKPAGNDVFNRSANDLIQAMSPLDLEDMAKLGRKTWVSQMSQRITSKAKDAAGLTDSVVARQAADWAWDTFAPAMFQEGRDTLFGRFFGLLRNGERLSGSLTNQIMRGMAKIEGTPAQAALGKISFTDGFAGHRPIEAILKDISPEEFKLVYRAGVTQTPAADLARLVQSGELSQKAVAAVAELQSINKAVISDLVSPALTSARMRERFSFLDGYIMPRLWRGDYRAQVVDERGREAFLASGRTAGEALGEARAVIAEAAKRGRVLKEGKAELAHVSSLEPDELARLTVGTTQRLANDAELMDVVTTALRQINILKSTTGKNPSLPGNPRTLMPRTGRQGTPDTWTPEHADVARQIEAHYSQLLKFSNYVTWRERWEPALMTWAKGKPDQYNNLMRKAQQMLGIEGQITNVLNRTLQPLLGPVMGSKPATKIAQVTNELMYNLNLAILNPTFAILNLLTPLQTVAPWISYVTRASTQEAERTMGLRLVFDDAGKVRGSTWEMNPMKVLGTAMKQLRSPDPELRSFMERAVNDNTLKAQLFEDWVGPQARGVTTLSGAYKSGGYVEFMRVGIKWMSDKSEQMSRMIAFNSAYTVGKNHFGLEGDALYRFARRGTEVTMYNYGTVDRARIMTGPIGSMFGLFKNWQMHFMGNMINYAGLGFKEGVWGPLMWQMGAATALGGLGATPLRMMADGLANHFEDKSSFLWLQENWNDSADEIYFGLPAFLGVSLQASATMPGTDVRNEAGNLMNFVAWERAKQLGQALGAGWQIQQASGQNMLRDPNVRDQLIQATMPRAVSRLVSGIEGNYITSMRTGYPQVRDVAPSDRVMHMLGFNMTGIEQYQVAGKELWKKQEARKAAIQGLGQTFAQAQLAGDQEEMTSVIERSIAMGLEVSSVLKSAQTVFRRETEGDLMSRYDQAEVAQYAQALQR